jgi:hypothetical protein
LISLSDMERSSRNLSSARFCMFRKACKSFSILAASMKVAWFPWFACYYYW